MELQLLFEKTITIDGNSIYLGNKSINTEINQEQTKTIFSDKWNQANKYESIEKLYEFQRNWFLKLYGFSSAEELETFLTKRNIIVDTGCGLGYKAAWFAQLAPHATVIGIDISDAVLEASSAYKDIPNLFFLQGDIANTGLKPGVVDFTVCDQVIMHTENPEETFKHLAGITSALGEFECYV